jgi:hypothetical protein
MRGLEKKARKGLLLTAIPTWVHRDPNDEEENKRPHFGIAEACLAVRKGELSQQAAADAAGISRGALRYRLSHLGPGEEETAQLQAAIHAARGADGAEDAPTQAGEAPVHQPAGGPAGTGTKEEAMQRCLELVKDGSSLRRAIKTVQLESGWTIARTSLRRRKDQPDVVSMRTKLPVEFELELVKFIALFQTCFHALTSKHVRTHVQAYLEGTAYAGVFKNNGRPSPGSPEKKKSKKNNKWKR